MDLACGETTMIPIFKQDLKFNTGAYWPVTYNKYVNLADGPKHTRTTTNYQIKLNKKRSLQQLKLTIC